MSKVFNFVLCILFAGFAAAAASAGGRRVRSSGSQGGSSSYSSSSSSSGSGSLGGSSGGNLGGGFGGSGGGYGGAPHVGAGGGGGQGFGYPGNFIFPGGPGFGFPNLPGFPAPNFMNPYQQWLTQFNAAQQAAQQQAALHQANMAALLAQQQAAAAAAAQAAQQSTAGQGSARYPNVDSNALDGRIGSPNSGSGTAYGGSYSGSGSFGPGTSGSSGTSGTSGNPDFVFTGASIGIGPQGGHGEAASFPGGPDGLGVRISEDYDPPSQPGLQGVFTSSSSGVSTVNGKTTSFKTSTFGKNDNGKITFKTINE